VIDETGLRRSIVAAFEHLKSHQETLTMLMGQIAALKAALQELRDERFLPLFEKHLADLEIQTNAASAALAARLDEAIRQVKAGGRF
jgi:hypothetical protein